MKKIVLFLIAFLYLNLYGNISYSKNLNSLIFSYQNTDNNTKNKYFTIAYPAKTIKLQVLSCKQITFDSNNNIIKNSELNPVEFIKVKKDFVMRELYGHTIEIKNKISRSKGYTILKSIKVKVSTNDKLIKISKISPAFLPAYKGIVDNFEYSYLKDIPLSKPKMLIISHTTLSQYINMYAEWKKQKGTDVIIANIEDIGNSSTELKNYILDQYNTPDPPDYLLLIGDVDGSFIIPSYYITEENDVTDQIYTELEGDDYLPEMIVGRISIDQLSEFSTIINKIFHYEKTPYLDTTDWFKHVVVVAGNYSPSPPFPSTPVSISQWMANNFRNHGFDNVSEIYYPPTYPGTNEIHSAINQGAAFVTYRGWGDANGWHFPEYHIGEGTEIGVIDLSNGFKLPIVTSIVCHTGDFANTAHDPCFGEAWLRAGTPANPKGGVAFIGPSDLHTHTKFNNAIYGGFYAGVLDEGIYDFGAAVLRGKVELFNNFPLDQAPGGLVEFYFRVYNILGDPNIQMWTDIPQQISCNIPDEISIGTNYITLNLPNLNGATVTAIKENENLYQRTTVENGEATLYLNMESEGTLLITITHPNKVPLIQEIDVQEENIDLGISQISSSDNLISGNSIDLNITVKNYGSETANNVVGILTSQSEYVTINNDTQNFGNISPSGTSTQTYNIQILPSCPNNTKLIFSLNLGTSTSKFELIANGLSFVISGYQIENPNGYINPGENANITFHLQNTGIFQVNNLSVVASGTDAINFSDNTATISSIQPDETQNITFNISLANDCAVGRILNFNFLLTDDTGRSTHCYYNIVAGNVTNTAPTGPDNYGYYAYDSFDTNYAPAPSFEWIEIDPTENGSGTLIQMEDDEVTTIDLPFNFKYYGLDYNQISICSNGWVSFVPTDEVDFINWNIPGYLGPYAMVAPYWDDLIGEDLGNNQFAPMNISYYFDESNHKFIIEWNKCYSRFDHQSFENFEVILFDPVYYQTPDQNGNILFNYKTINNPDSNNNFATVGIENHLQNDGVLYTFANQYPASATQLQNNLSILFTTIKPDNYTHSNNDALNILNDTRLINNYPNPFNPETTISFFIQNSNDDIKLSIYNLKGEKIKTLVNNRFHKGIHKKVWNGKDKSGKIVPTGIYFVQLKSNNKIVSTKKILLLK